VSKVSQLRRLRDGGTVGELQKTLDSVQRDLAPSTREPRAARVIVAEHAADQSPFGMLGPALGMGASTGLVIALVIFMLLERRDLRDRIVGVIGHGHIVLTTRALDEAGQRVARQLLMQTLVNAIYGVVAGSGLWLLGVPYPVVWAALGAVLRFVPYVGPAAAFVAPIVIAIAAMEGWRHPAYVLVFMVALELFTNLVLETVLYAARPACRRWVARGRHLWTWLGGDGAVMAIRSPCVVVVGNTCAVQYLATLMADTSA
jgi:predicted PurR-regulated permease PerM